MWPFSKSTPPRRSPDTVVHRPVISHTRKRLSTPDRDRQLLQKALRLVLAFSEDLVNDPPDLEVRDEAELPASKALMIEAFRLVLCAETRPKWHTAFYYAGLQLSHYWPDVGARLTVPDGLFPGGERTEPKGESRRRTDWNAVVAFSAAYSRVGPEQDRIAALFDEVILRPAPVSEESPPRANTVSGQ